MRVFTDTSSKFGRRRLMKNGALLGGSAVATGLFASPSIVLAQGARPEITHGVQTGDISANGAMLWSRADRPSRMLVDLATTESFSNARRVIGPAALEVGDYAAKLDLTGLPAGQRIFARVRFQDLQNLDVESTPVTASFTTAPPARRDGPADPARQHQLPARAQRHPFGDRARGSEIRAPHRPDQTILDASPRIDIEAREVREGHGENLSKDRARDVHGPWDGLISQLRRRAGLGEPARG